MVHSPIRLAATTSAIVALVALSALAFAPQARGQEPKPDGKDAKIQELLKERAATARKLADQVMTRVKTGGAKFEELLEPTRLAHEAALDLCETHQDRVQVLEKFLAAAMENEGMAARIFKVGEATESVVLQARAERLRVEIALERAKAKGSGKGGAGADRQDLEDQAALAERQAAVRRAAVAVVEAQKAKAQATLAAIKSLVDQAKASESLAESQAMRIQRLLEVKAVEETLVIESRSKLEAAKAKRRAAEANVVEAESQVAIEAARVMQAVLEFEEAALRAKQLKARLANP